MRRPAAAPARAVAAVLLAAACGGDPTVAPPPAAPPPAAPPAAPAPPASPTLPDPLVPGRAYLGREGYVEYVAGDAPVLYTVPHGGALRPDAIPDRTDARCGADVVTVTDLETVDLARRIQQAHHARFGTWPHVVVNHLSRRKLDPNRPLAEAACGDAAAAAAWAEFHAFAGAARAAMVRGAGGGWHVDLHGHGHAVQRLELGYLVDGPALRLSDAALDAAPAAADSSSVRTLARGPARGLAALLRGPRSLGALYARAGIPAVPSDVDPAPAAGEAYFSGGYATARHGCGVAAPSLGGASDGLVCGVQIEANYVGVRDTEANRQRFADVTAAVLAEYLAEHAGLRLDAAPSPRRGRP